MEEQKIEMRSKEVNEWFHKDEVIEMLTDFALEVMEVFKGEETQDLSCEIYAKAKYDYEKLGDCEGFKKIIESFSTYFANEQSELDDHHERNLEYLK